MCARTHDVSEASRAEKNGGTLRVFTVGAPTLSARLHNSPARFCERPEKLFEPKTNRLEITRGRLPSDTSGTGNSNASVA